jgi:hypothetical protein
MCQKSDLGWKLSAYRRMPSGDRYPFVTALVAGTAKTPSPAKVAAEKAAWLKSLRCHPKCRDAAARSDSACFADAPGYTLGPDKCECCGTTLKCSKGRTDHEYVELTVAECRKLGVYHAGNCYHVNRCKHCGNVSAYDSSD